MSNLCVGDIKVNAFTLEWETPFTGYVVQLRIIPDADLATPVLLSGAINSTNPNLWNIATTQASDLAHAGNYQCQPLLTNVTTGEDFRLPAFDVEVNPAI